MLLDGIGQSAFSGRIGFGHSGSRGWSEKAPQTAPRWIYKSSPALWVPVLAGCGGPLSTLEPAGPIAGVVADLWWAMLIGAALVTLFVLALLAVAWRRSASSGDTSETVWTLGLGVGFPLTVLVALVGYGFWVGEQILSRDDGAFRVSARAEQWGWSFTQPGPDGADLTTRGTLYVPANRAFDIEVSTADVIHSFWVPRLGGKIDAVPGRANVVRLHADTPGVYEGLCAEFCGIGHSIMRFQVVVYEAGNFPVLSRDPAAEGSGP